MGSLGPRGTAGTGNDKSAALRARSRAFAAGSAACFLAAIADIASRTLPNAAGSVAAIRATRSSCGGAGSLGLGTASADGVLADMVLVPARRSGGDADTWLPRPERANPSDGMLADNCEAASWLPGASTPSADSMKGVAETCQPGAWGSIPGAAAVERDGNAARNFTSTAPTCAAAPPSPLLKRTRQSTRGKRAG